MLVQDRKSCGKEFHSVGAAQLNEHLPISVRMSGTFRRLVRTNEGCAWVGRKILAQIDKKV